MDISRMLQLEPNSKTGRVGDKRTDTNDCGIDEHEQANAPTGKCICLE